MSTQQKKFFVNANGQMQGPYEVLAIISKVQSGDLKATDYMYVEAQDDWVLICTHPDFLEAHKNQKPAGMKNQAPVPRDIGDQSAFGERTVVAQAQAKPAGAASTSSTETVTQAMAHAEVTAPAAPTSEEWYVLKGKNRYGPFPYEDLLRMLQEKAVFEFDYVWKQGLETWKRIAELENFSHDHVRDVMSKHEFQSSQVFFRRRHERSEFNCGVLIHDNNRVWKGESVQISEGGAGIVMENAMMLPGQNVYLHFKPSPNSKPFNALCEIVSKRYVKGVKSKDSPLFYGIKFINIHKQDKEHLKVLATQFKDAA